MPYTSNIYQLRQFTQRYSHTHPHLVLRLSIHLSNCSLTTLHIPQKLQSLPVSTFTSTGCSESVMSTLCGPMDCSPLGSSVHGIFPARILEWVAMPSSRGASQPRDQTCISCASYLAGGFFITEPLEKPNIAFPKLK